MFLLNATLSLPAPVFLEQMAVGLLYCCSGPFPAQVSVQPHEPENVSDM